MRADARRNRERITAAAVSLLTERGVEVPMEDIAKAAGVGVGTLYRHFPDRRALLEEIAADTLRAILEFGEDREVREATGWEGLIKVALYCMGRPLALVKNLAEGPAPQERLDLQQAVNTLLETLAERAQQEGALRGDITPGDAVDVLSTLVCRPGAHPGEALVRVVFDGLAR